jgi:quinol monooxygenase YgiN
MKKNETQLVCIARFTAFKGEENKLMENLFSLIDETRKEGGCIRYELNQSIDNPCEITFIEKWYDQVTVHQKLLDRTTFQ